MKEKIKLTELTKEELRQVRGGTAGNMGIVKVKCDCKAKNQQVFGLDESSGTIKTPKPIMEPIVKPSS